jgi:4a-hydroxytetrahydrobiopterin dehydratase
MSTPEGWSEVDGALEREFRFKDFAAALDFVNRVGELAEQENHHPDVLIHGYNHVKLRWHSHAAAAVTAKDAEMAGRSAALA